MNSFSDMNYRTKTGLEIIQVAAILGVLGNILLRETPWGLNVFLFNCAFAAGMAMLILRRRPEFRSRHMAALVGALVFFAACFAWRDSIELRIADTFAILAILGVLFLPRMKTSASAAGIFHYIVGFLWSSFNALLAPFVLAASDIDWKIIPKNGWTRHLIAVLRGVLVAAPILLIFGALFVAADAAFEGFINRVFNIPENVISHILLTSLFAWLSAGYLRGILIFGPKESPAAANDAKENFNFIEEIKNAAAESSPLGDLSILEHINKPEDAESPHTVRAKNDEDAKTCTLEKAKKLNWADFDNSLAPPVFTLGAIETGIILGLINLLFLSFVIIQIPYLFGGMELVQKTPDFKLADYARRGFGELVAVAALVLPILLVSHWLLRKDDPWAGRLYNILAGIQIALLFVIMASAAQRLFLLTGNLGYGLTTVRLYPMIFMIWLGIIFVWFAMTVLRGMRKHFAWGALWSAFVVLGAVHFLNPDDFIVRTNVRLLQEGRMFDPVYVGELSDDAIPAVLESFPVLNAEQQCIAKMKLSRRLIHAIAEDDIRTWNWSRNKARNLLREAGSLDATGCADSKLWFAEHGDF